MFVECLFSLWYLHHPKFENSIPEGPLRANVSFDKWCFQGKNNLEEQQSLQTSNTNVNYTLIALI